MSRMLHELLRWERAAPAATPAARWRTWAHALADRYAHLAGHFTRPGMVLPPAAPGERHEHVHWSLGRHLHLAVRPVLPVLARVVTAPAAGAPAAPPQSAPGRRAVKHGVPRLEQRAAPLQRVVANTAVLRMDAAHLPSAYPRQALLIDTCLQTLQRVVELRRRVEQWTHPAIAADSPRTPMVADRPLGGQPVALPAPVPLAPPPKPVLVAGGGRATSVSASAAPGREPAAAASQGAPGPGWGRAARAAEADAPRINIEKLTDQVVRQIDREIVAHRERMGRI